MIPANILYNKWLSIKINNIITRQHHRMQEPLSMYLEQRASESYFCINRRIKVMNFVNYINKRLIP